MTRIHRDTAEIALRRMTGMAPRASYPFLDIDPATLAHPEVGLVFVAAAMDDALAGSGGSTAAARAYLRSVKGVAMDRTSFSILSMGDVDPLVAVAMTHAQGEEMGVLTLVDVDLGGRSANLNYSADMGPAPMIDLEYGLGGGVKWMGWQRILRCETDIALPDTVLSALVGRPLTDLIDHRALRPAAMLIDGVRGEQVDTRGSHDWIDLADLPDLHDELGSKGMTGSPAAPFHRKDDLVRDCLRALIDEAEARTARLREAVWAAGVFDQLTTRGTPSGA